MPASAAQVFGPTTVDPGFDSTGEKTLLTMSTTLPAGGRNVIIVSFVRNATFSTEAQGTFRIYKGETLLYESLLTEYLNYVGHRAKPVLLIAVDTSPAGNDTYTFRINITTAGTATGAVHVQGMVIKTDDAVWGYNATAVSIAAGATATVTSISTSFPANSKVAIIAVAYGYPSTAGQYLIGAGNIKLKSGDEAVSSNQFDTGGYDSIRPLWASLTYLDEPTSSSQTYSIEITNNTNVEFNCYAEIVAFTVIYGAFLDTGSVALTSGSQVTVGNLSTTLRVSVAVIGLAAAENASTTNVTAFNADDIVLQKDNSTTDQISNLAGWYIGGTILHSRSGTMPLFRFDTGVSNPSYQIKMTARASGINGEAKILAFSVYVPQAYTQTLTDKLGLLDKTMKTSSIVKRDECGLSDIYARSWAIYRTYYDRIGLLDTYLKATSIMKTELAGLSDKIARSPSSMRSEMLGLTDTVSRSPSAIKLDSLGLMDVFSRTWSISRIYGEAVGLADTVSAVKTFFRYFDERIGLSDMLWKSPSMTLRDYITLIDRLLPYLLPRIVTVIKTQPHYIVEIGKVSELISKLMTPLPPDTSIVSQEFPRYLAEKDKTSELRTKIKKQQT
jgi:hypothetical protein